MKPAGRRSNLELPVSVCSQDGFPPLSATGSPIKYLMQECVRLRRSTCHTDIHVHWALEGRVPGFIWSCSPPHAYSKPSLLFLLLFRREYTPPCASSLFLSSPSLQAWYDDGCGTMEQVRRVGASALGSFIPKAVSRVGVYRRHTRSVITLPSLRFPKPSHRSPVPPRVPGSAPAASSVFG